MTGLVARSSKSKWKIEQTSWKENQCANACLPIAPTSECFHANMERVWGTALSSIYIIIPTLFVIMAIILFISEVHFLQRFARRKRVRYTLYWILGIYPGEYQTNTTLVFKQFLFSGYDLSFDCIVHSSLCYLHGICCWHLGSGQMMNSRLRKFRIGISEWDNLELVTRT